MSVKSNQRPTGGLIKEIIEQDRASFTESVISDNMRTSRWHEPSQLNHFRRFIKVSITSKDEATIFIVFTKPNMPEFRINNYTDRKVHFYQEGVKTSIGDRYCMPAVIGGLDPCK